MTAPAAPSRSLFDWMFRSRETGEVVLGQAPNLAASVTFLGAIVALVTRSEGTRRTAAQVVVIGGLVWAVQEIFSGVNPFRRLQGLLTLGGLSLLARD